MVKHFYQLSLSDTYRDCEEVLQNNKPKFLELLSKHMDLSSLIPAPFYWSYYKSLGRDREYSLTSMLAALILQKVLGIPTVSLLILFLLLCREAREFCGFRKVPDNSRFTRFKQDFVLQIESLFHHLVDVTAPICQSLDAKLASTLVFDTSGIEPYVTENNPKFINALIKKLKRAYKDNPDIDVYKMAYGLMPSCASANHQVKQLYINGCFCYAYKFAIMTNGLGIVRNISFLDEDFMSKHPEIEVDKKSDSPEEDKSISDSKSLKPVLSDFFKLHPQVSYDTFLGDAIFDSFATYPLLLKEFKFKKVLIPFNIRNSNTGLAKPGYNESGWPLCPKDSSKAMTPCGWTREKGRSDRFKWICPETHWDGRKRLCHCPNPCTDKPSGRMIYTSSGQDLRSYPGIIRDSEEWITEYKTRCTIERTIQFFKDPMAVGNTKTSDRFTIKADLFLAGITQLITVILADRIHQPKYFRSLKPLIA
ncbi:transposase [Candidatus Formimonas warabiya]|uniref:Transposase n=1 Tax=Formimonas warabiya TaxID=1761012 RepID=A0A3G1KZ34_FORW1|nr:transposase [Candidatus Formimonas warabiya]ATW27721.1 transposase [Candidatus Formimonas warabiya]